MKNIYKYILMVLFVGFLTQSTFAYPISYTLKDGVLTVKYKDWKDLNWPIYDGDDSDILHTTYTSRVPWYGARDRVIEVIIEPGTNTSIGDHTFHRHTNLKKVTIPSNIKYINKEVFLDCHALEEIDLPSSIEYIGEKAFIGTNLKKVISRNTTAPGTGTEDCGEKDAFFYGENSSKKFWEQIDLYIPKGSIDQYKTKYSWKYAKNVYYIDTDKEAVCEIEEIEITEGKSIKIEKGNTAQLHFKFKPECSKSKLTWRSGNQSILTVDEKGKITTLKDGKTNVTVKTDNIFAFDIINIEVYSESENTPDPKPVTPIDPEPDPTPTPVDPTPADPTHKENDLGNGVKWIYYPETTTIRFSGKGVIPTNTALGLTSDYAKWRKHYKEATEVIIEEGVTEVGTNAFFEFNKLTKVSLPTTLKAIKHNAFANCNLLESLTIPENVIIIEGDAINTFTNNYVNNVRQHKNLTITNLSKVPQTLSPYEQLGMSYPFLINIDVTKVTLLVPYESLELYKKANVWKEFLNISPIGGYPEPEPESDLGPFVEQYLGNGVTWRYYTSSHILKFFGNGVLPEITYMGSSRSNSSLSKWHKYYKEVKEVVIEEGITELVNGSFYEFPALTKVYLPLTLTTIGAGVFQHCPLLENIIIPENVHTVHASSFSNKDPKHLSLTSLSKTPQRVISEEMAGNVYDITYYMNFSQAILYVPSESLELYRKANGWKEFSNIKAIDTQTYGTDEINTDSNETIFKHNTTSLQSINASNVWSSSGKVYINGGQEDITIYNMIGTTLYNGRKTNGTVSIPLQEGIVVVRGTGWFKKLLITK